ncbi:hypothetical protein MMC16_001827 [Acarospora aff. strigata]|nr:hypothetical protein [Acarospora aff. strigata]
MSNFLVELFSSIFTPGPTPTLLVATNASFAALQLLLLALLIATYSIHFLILSFISAGLWWAINWFAAELQAAKEEEARKAEGPGSGKTTGDADDSGTETEAAEDVDRGDSGERKEGGLTLPEAHSVRRRRSLGEQSGEMSTDSEWEKVDEEARDR